jgi:hypothetical protein
VLTPAQSLSGRYQLKAVVQSVKGTSGLPQPGDHASATWRVSATCKASCTATVTSSSGSVFHLTYKVGTWSGHGGSTYCTDQAGNVVPSTQRADTVVVHLDPPAPSSKPAKSLTGTETFTIVAGIPACQGTHGTWTQTLTLTRT